MVNISVLELHRDIGIERTPWIERKLREIELFSLDSTTILDLTDLGYADSTLANALIDAHMQALHESHVCIVASKCISRLFHITALDRLFRTFDNISSARASFEAARSLGIRSYTDDPS